MADNRDEKKRVEAAIALVYIDMLQDTQPELKYGLNTARVTNGAHVVCNVQNKLVCINSYRELQCFVKQRY